MNRNVATSIRQRLLNLSKVRGEDFQRILDRFVLERLLYRLSVSPYRDHFLLKGAALYRESRPIAGRRPSPRSSKRWCIWGWRTPG